jgi:hypothetical protein
MSFAITNLIYTLGLLVGMLFLLEVGRRIGLWRLAVDTEGARAGIGTVEGALLALLGLLIAFSFSGAAARFDARRQQIIDEANDIGSAYMLVDLLPSEAQPPLRDKFRLYVDSRLEAYRKMPDLVAARAEFERSKSLQNEIWTQAIAATRDSGYQPVAMLILPAISKMINISTERTMALHLASVNGRRRVGGIGFTMSLFIAGLAFPNAADYAAAKIAIFIASVIAAVLGTIILYPRRDEESEPEVAEETDAVCSAI